jgi:hypothetical protein
VHESGRTAGARPHRPQLWSTRVERHNANILLRCPTLHRRRRGKVGHHRILRTSFSIRTPKRCPVGTSPSRTTQVGAEPENLAVANNDNGNKSCATEKERISSLLTPQPEAQVNGKRLVNCSEVKWTRFAVRVRGAFAIDRRLLECRSLFFVET